MSTCKRLRSGSFENGVQQNAAPRYVNGATCVSLPLTQPSRSPRFLLNLLIHHEQYYPIFDRICSYLSIADILTLRRTCKQLSNLYHVLLETQWNVNSRLRRFVKDPQGIRTQLGRHDALISGGFALQFFERVTWKESDLDIFIESGPGPIAFGNYLTEVEGYYLTTTKDNTEYPNSDIIEVSTYARPNDHDATETLIQIISTRKIPVHPILMGFYTSAVVNIISWNRAYAIFPLPTFIHHKTYLLRSPTDFISSLLSKYSRRGWRTQDILWPEEETPLHPFQLERHIGDRYTWTIPLDTSNVERPKTPDYLLEWMHFSVGNAKDNQNRLWYSLDAQIFKACTLRYRYTFSPRNSLGDFWLSFLGKRMERLTTVEILKMDLEERPPFTQAPLYTRQGTFDLPPTWDFFDDELPKWYKVWQQLQSQEQKTITS